MAAGPWARGAGEGFVSLQLSAEEAQADLMAGLWEPETYLSFYGEYGLGRRMTLGADIGGGDISRQATAFLRYTLSAPEAAWQIAVHGGLGARQTGDADPHGLIRVGASIGRGFGEGGGGAWYMPLAHDGGWGVLEAVALYDITDEAMIYQLEGTIGLHLAPRLSATFSVKAEDWPGADPLVTLAPSLIYSVSDATSLRLGARGAVAGSENVGLSLSLWHEF
ncbi:hypothetical protein [Hasllibacter sp. MH4015]|uniref:hypothetical protein n=1 Tax=Hasllibacter sp. MH4015 TaxID=2854029 RepID=UPI001CD53C80|nr:hypothetical protein [Hasllibacter sp. MH4015]